MQPAVICTSFFKPQGEGPDEADAHCLDGEVEAGMVSGAGVGGADKSEPKSLGGSPRQFVSFEGLQQRLGSSSLKGETERGPQRVPQF